MKLQIYDSNLFIGQSYFFHDGSKNFSIFQPILNTFTMATSLTETIVALQSKKESIWKKEKIRPLTTSNNSLSPELKWDYSRIRLEFKKKLLKTRQSNFYSKKCTKFIYCLWIR